MRDGISPTQVPIAEVMALYAIEVQAGRIKGPYTSERALVFAHQAGMHRALGGVRE